MKILPITNTLNINKNHNRQVSFKEIDDGGGYYISTDSYIDETGLHYTRRRTELPSFAPIIEDSTERIKPKNLYEIKEKAFLTQSQCDAHTDFNPEIRKYKKMIQKCLYDLDIDGVEISAGYVNKYLKYTAQEIFTQPFFALGLADIPLTDNNKASYINVLNILEEHADNVNVMDENGITLLEKVMNSENTPYLETIKRMYNRNSAYGMKDGIAYEPMQKYAFDNIQNSEFKEKCKNLPIVFFEIIDDIKRKDLISLDKDIQEQMKCGFCDLEYAIRKSLYLPVRYSSEYARIVLNIAKKHFPNEVKAFAKAYL